MVIYATLLGTHQTFGVFFKPIQTEFGWSRTVTATAFFIGGLTAAALSPVSGALSDRYGPRLVITASALLSAVGYVLVSRVQSQWQLYSVFVLMSSGMSFWVPLQITVSRWFTVRRGLALGLTGIGGGLAQALWPPLGQFLIDHFGWRSAYLILAAILGVVVVSVAQVLRGSPAQKGLQPYGEAMESPQASANAQGAVPAVSLRQALRLRTFWMVAAATAFGSLTLQMVWVHLVPYVTDPGIGVSATVGASLLSVIGWSNLTGKVVMGSVSDRIGPRATLAICYGGAGAAMVWLLVAKELWMLYLFVAVLGFFYGGWIPMQAAIAGSLFGLSSMGVVLGTMQMGSGTAGATGSMLGGYIFDVTDSYFWAFLIGAVLYFSASALVILAKKPQGVEVLPALHKKSF